MRHVYLILFIICAVLIKYLLERRYRKKFEMFDEDYFGNNLKSMNDLELQELKKLLKKRQENSFSLIKKLHLIEKEKERRKNLFNL